MLAEDFGTSIAAFSMLYAHVSSAPRKSFEVRIASDFKSGSFQFE